MGSSKVHCVPIFNFTLIAIIPIPIDLAFILLSILFFSLQTDFLLALNIHVTIFRVAFVPQSQCIHSLCHVTFPNWEEGAGFWPGIRLEG